jgi:hypothetical protein
MQISAEGKIGIAIGLIALAGGGAIMIFPDQFWIGETMMAIAAIGGVWLGLHHFGIRQQIIIPAIFMIITLAAVAFNYADRHYLSVPQTHEACIQEWMVKATKGVDGFSYIMKVNTKQLLQFSEAYKLAFIIRVQYADRDRMTDTAIEKSGLYTIADSTVILAHPSSKILRFAINQVNPVEYTLILFPSKLTIEQISSLGDVEHIGGRILATSLIMFPMGGPPAATRSQGK